jgi:hypothetical protein
MAIRRQREIAISIPDPVGLGSSILTARWAADARVGRLRRSLTHLQVRSLLCSPAAFASTVQRADSRFLAPRQDPKPSVSA